MKANIRALSINIVSTIIVVIVTLFLPRPDNVILCVSLGSVLFAVVQSFFMTHAQSKYSTKQIFLNATPFLFAVMSVGTVWLLFRSLRQETISDTLYVAGLLGFWVGNGCLFSRYYLHDKIETITVRNEKTDIVNIARWEELLAWIHRQDIAFTATCFAFKQNESKEDEVDLALIYNGNFNWWLAPGGHVEVRDNQFPEDVAREKALAEASLEVEILAPKHYNQVAYEACSSRIPPSAVYILRLDDRAKCRKLLHHAIHYDFSYVAKVKRVTGCNSKWSVLWVPLRLSSSKQDIMASLDAEIQRYCQLNNRQLSGTPYPKDLVERVAAAIRTYREAQQPSQAQSTIMVTTTTPFAGSITTPSNVSTILPQIHRPISVCWDLTSQCNESCQFCFRAQHRREISLVEGQTLLDQLVRMGVKKVSFVGGEPLLVPHLPALLKFAKGLGLLTSVITNGILLEQRWNEIIPYTDWLTLPLDGSTADIQTKVGRGKDHYGRTLMLLGKLSNTSVKLKVNTVICRPNMHSIADISTCISKYTVRRWKLFRFYPVRGTAKQNAVQYDVTDGEFEVVISDARRAAMSMPHLICEFADHEYLDKTYFSIYPDGIVRFSSKGEDHPFSAFNPTLPDKLFLNGHFDPEWHYSSRAWIFSHTDKE